MEISNGHRHFQAARQPLCCIKLSPNPLLSNLSKVLESIVFKQLLLDHVDHYPLPAVFPLCTFLPSYPRRVFCGTPYRLMLVQAPLYLPSP